MPPAAPAIAAPPATRGSAALRAAFFGRAPLVLWGLALDDFALAAFAFGFAFEAAVFDAFGFLVFDCDFGFDDFARFGADRFLVWV
ncbi:MAG TPA: hypothetical protein VNN15_07440 [Solirubrobacterales bacterium]|nr:hypothetical protein [Solirubrobacterales bacterium]